MSRYEVMVKRRYLDPDNKVYLFMESFENLQKKEVLGDELRSLHLQEIRNKNGGKPCSHSGDPILHYVLGFAKIPSMDTFLEYCRQSAQKRAEDLVYLDICYFLNENDRARQFADEQKLNHEFIPRIGVPDIIPIDLDSRISEKWITFLYAEKADSNEKSQWAKLDAEISGFLFRFNHGQNLSVLCEMAARGFVWDAFVLMSFCFPAHDMVGVLRTLLWEKYNLGWIDEVIREPVTVTYESLSKLGVNLKDSYRLMCKWLVSSSNNAFGRITAFSNIHVCLLATIIEAKDDNSAKDMMDDYFRFVSANPAFTTEGLPALQKSYVKQAFAVISDMIGGVMRVSNISIDDKLAGSKEASLDISGLVLNWVARGVLPTDSSFAQACRGISDVLHSFIGDVIDIDEMSINGVDYKPHALLSLRIAEVLFKPALSRSYYRLIYELMKECCFTEVLVEKLIRQETREVRGNSPSKFLLSYIRECFLLIENMLTKERPHSDLRTPNGSAAEDIRIVSIADEIVSANKSEAPVDGNILCEKLRLIFEATGQQDEQSTEAAKPSPASIEIAEKHNELNRSSVPKDSGHDQMEDVPQNSNIVPDTISYQATTTENFNTQRISTCTLLNADNEVTFNNSPVSVSDKEAKYVRSCKSANELMVDSVLPSDINIAIMGPVTAEDNPSFIAPSLGVNNSENLNGCQSTKTNHPETELDLMFAESLGKENNKIFNL